MGDVRDEIDLINIGDGDCDMEVEEEEEKHEDDNGDGEDEKDEEAKDASSVSEDNPFKYQSRRKRRNASKVWNFVTAISPVEAKCIKCEASISHPLGQTSILINHLKGCDGDAFKVVRDDIEEKKEKVKKAKEEVQKKRGTQEKITNFVSVTKSLPKTTTQKIDNSVVEWVVSTNNSFSGPENYFFRKMVFELNSSYVCPGRSKVTTLVDKKRVEVDEQLKVELNKDIEGCDTVSLTSDGGTSCDRMKTKKNSLTASRITEDFKLKTDTLAVSIAEGSQTGEVIRTD